MRDVLVKENIISLVPHALDIGLELMKAEIAIKLNLHYTQDNKLELKPLKIENEPKEEIKLVVENNTSREDINLLKQSKNQLANILNNLKTR